MNKTWRVYVGRLLMSLRTEHLLCRAIERFYTMTAADDVWDERMRWRLSYMKSGMYRVGADVIERKRVESLSSIRDKSTVLRQAHVQRSTRPGQPLTHGQLLNREA